jgi:hypothetical protein
MKPPKATTMPENESAKSGRVKVADAPNKRATGHPRNAETPPKRQSDPEIRLSQFSANPRNPRKITDEQLEALKKAMAAYGDLSGLVVNLNTGHLVGGHQRVKILGNLPVEILRRFPQPTPRGTVAEGVVLYRGERFVYREVKWDEATENAAMIAANKHGGDWDLPALSEILTELDGQGYELPLTGFSAKELEAMLTKMTPDTDAETTIAGEGDETIPAHIRMVQLFLTVETLPEFMEQVRVLGEDWEITNITDTVVKAVAECYGKRNGKATAQVAAHTE